MTKWKSGPTSGIVQHIWYATFRNETTDEIESIDVRLKMLQGSRTTYRCKPVTIRVFQNNLVPHKGSLLALNNSDPVDGLVFEFPTQYWNTASTEILEIVGVRVYKKDQDLRDPGHLYAWMGGHDAKDTIALFKKRPELLKVKNGQKMSVMLMSFAASEPQAIQFIASHGGKWTDKATDGTTIVHMAALHDPANLQLALKHVPNPNVMTKERRTPLIRAIKEGNSLTVPWLLEHKANPNVVDAFGHPPAYYAIFAGQKAMLQSLADHGANVHFHDKNGYGWLHYAARDNTHMLDEVARYGLKADDRVGKGSTPLMLVAYWGMQDAALWLLQHGANPHLKNAQGQDCFALSKIQNTLHTDRFFRQLVAQAGRH